MCLAATFADSLPRVRVRNFPARFPMTPAVISRHHSMYAETSACSTSPAAQGLDRNVGSVPMEWSGRAWNSLVLLFDPSKVTVNGLTRGSLPPGVDLTTQMIDPGRLRVLIYGLSATPWSDGVIARLNVTAAGLTPLASTTIQVVAPGGTAAGVQASDPDGVSSTASAIAATVRRASGTLQVTPARLTFGRVRVGRSQTRALTLKNIHRTESVEVDLSVTGPFRIVGPAHRVIPARKRAAPPVKVVFTPTARGAASGNLVIKSTDIGHPSLSVPLTGTGR